MCGIALALGRAGENGDCSRLCASVLQALLPFLKARGPDSNGTELLHIGLGHQQQYVMSMAATLLQLRGNQPTLVPHKTASGGMLCYNGEVYGGLDMQDNANDGEALAAALEQCQQEHQLLHLLSQLQGPFALLYWQQQQQQLWIARDRVGRRSLVCWLPPLDADQPLVVASNTTTAEGLEASRWIEVPPGVYSIRLEQSGNTAASSAAVTGAVEGRAANAVERCLPASMEQPHARQPCLLASKGDHGAEQAAVAACCEVLSGAVARGKCTQSSNGCDAAASSAATHVLGQLAAPSQQQAAECDADDAGPVCTAIGSEEQWTAVLAGCRSGGGAAPDEAGDMQQEQAVPEGHDPQHQGTSNQSHGLQQAEVEAQLEAAPLKALQVKFVRALQDAIAWLQFQCHPWVEQPDVRHVAAKTAGCWWEYGRLAALVIPPAASVAVPGDSVVLLAGAASTDVAGKKDMHCTQVQVTSLKLLQEAVAVRCRTINKVTFVAPSQFQHLYRSMWLQMPSCGTTPALPDRDGTIPVSISSSLPPGTVAAALIPAAPLLILFSGGVDSTLLAALAHQYVQPDLPIDLINICFDNSNSPDRLAALDALQELHERYPTRCWRLLGVNASLKDVDAHRDHLVQLLRPAGTVMDLNIGAALWLAARGEGMLLRDISKSLQPSQYVAGQLYRSMSRVVFLGHGADELCGGYGRHRTCFRDGSWEKLQRELTLDMRRMWLRNLGRDDRLVADHGREARHPFLDEHFIAHLLSLALWDVTDLRQPPGTGDKRLLRQLLRLLGLPRAAARVKRAIQFGSRLGKLTNVRDFGSNRAANMANAGSLSIR